MHEELRWRITTFFNCWRQRYAFINDLDFRMHNYQANVLLWSSFDALSNLWAGNIGKDRCTGKQKRRIFDAFLAYYGGDLFQKVSLPDIWSRVDKGDIVVDRQQNLKLPEKICTFLSQIGERRTPTAWDEHCLRQGSEDWKLDAIINDVLTIYPEANICQIEEWLVLSRYGAIAYKEMRSAYIHEGRSGKRSHGFDLHESEIRPTYLSGIYTTPPTIGFKVEFMLGILKTCIDGFEAETLKLHRDPVPN